MDDYVIAVDLGGTNLRCAIAGRDCEILRCISKPSGASLPGEQVLKGIEDGIAEILKVSGKQMTDIAGIGIGMPGIVDTEKGILHRAANFPAMVNFPVAEILRKKYNIPIFLYHDVDMATVAEREFGAGRGKDHIVCVMIGTGIGMGMICNGRLYRGANNGAGNLGHMIIADYAGLPIPSRDSILEKMAAAPAIRDRAARYLGQGISGALAELYRQNPESIDARVVFQAAREGDPLSMRVVEETAHILAMGIANIINILSPEIIVIGGGVAMAGELLFGTLISSVREIVSGIHTGEINIVPSQLGADAVERGVAHTVWSSL